jgi:RNA polymerase sigma factor (sigma-70 family)
MSSRENQGMVRVLICEDHRMLADALATLLVDDGRGEVVCEPLDTAEAAVEAVTEHRPDVVLMDINLRGPMSGIEATRQIKESFPDTKVLVVTAFSEDDYLVPAVEAGASGLLEKWTSLDDVLDAIERVAAGDMLIDPTKLSRLMRTMAQKRESNRDATLLLDQLTEREREVLQLSAEGMSTAEVAEHLVISGQTVQTHVRNVLAKLGARSKLQAVAFAAKNGYVERRRG